jgi:hypothetical protein
MALIPLQAIPAQEWNILLGGQECRIKIYEKKGFVYCDLWKDDVLVWAGIRCQNGIKIKPAAYLDFKGDLMFTDLNGRENPHYEGFGSRWVLQYLEG